MKRDARICVLQVFAGETTFFRFDDDINNSQLGEGGIRIPNSQTVGGNSSTPNVLGDWRGRNLRIGTTDIWFVDVTYHPGTVEAGNPRVALLTFRPAQGAAVLALSFDQNGNCQFQAPAYALTASSMINYLSANYLNSYNWGIECQEWSGNDGVEIIASYSWSSQGRLNLPRYLILNSVRLRIGPYWDEMIYRYDEVGNLLPGPP
jgi:hypothetical protein